MSISATARCEARVAVADGQNQVGKGCGLGGVLDHFPLSHVPMLSQPDIVIDVIRKAAAVVKQS
jgi:hypothetical protein